MVSRFMAGMLAAVLAASVAQAASTLQSGLDDVLRRKPDLDAGEQKYNLACSGCHGAAGDGQRQGQVPRIAGQRFAVIASELVGFRLGRRLDGRMQARADGHVLAGPQDMADVAAYAAQLSGSAIDQGSGNQVECGAQLYANRCSACHGARAQGSDRPVVPRLAGQNNGYLVRQLQDLVEGRRPAASRDHLKPLQSMDRDQMTGLADYLSRLP
jgi:cytochrome c553